MKRTLLTFLGAIALFNSNGQENPSWEVGMNTSSIAARMFGSEYVNNSIFQLRKFTANGNAFRMGLDGNYSFTEMDEYTNSSSGLNINFGFEKYRTVLDKWNIFYGPSLGIGWSLNQSDRPNIENKLSAYSGRIGFDFGIRYEINDRISLGTRTGLRANLNLAEQTNVYYGSKSNEKSSNFSGQFYAPTALFLNIQLGKN